MALNFGKLKEKMKEQGTKKAGSDTFWSPEEGEQTVRIFALGEDLSRDYHLHYNMGKYSGLVCLKKSFNENCPICEFASKLWFDGTEEDKQLAKKLFAKQRFYTVVVEKDEEGKLKSGPKIWSHSAKIFGELRDTCLDPDYGDITSVTEGNDVRVIKRMEEGKLFADISVKVRPKKSKLCEGLSKKDLDELLSAVPTDILSHLNMKSEKEMEDILEKWSGSVSISPSTEELNKDEGLNLKESKQKESNKEKNSVDDAFAELDLA